MDKKIQSPSNTCAFHAFLKENTFSHLNVPPCLRPQLISGQGVAFGSLSSVLSIALYCLYSTLFRFEPWALSTPCPHSFVFLPSALVLHILPICYYPGCRLITSSHQWPSREVVKVIPKRILVTNLNFSYLEETNVISFIINRSSSLEETILSSVPKARNPRKENLSWRKTQN